MASVISFSKLISVVGFSATAVMDDKVTFLKAISLVGNEF